MQDATYNNNSFWKQATQPQQQPQSQQEEEKQEQISQKSYKNSEKKMTEEVKSPTEYETTSIYMEFDDSSDSDDYSDTNNSTDDDTYIVQPTTTTLIRSGRRSPTMGPYPKNDVLCNPFLSNGSNGNNLSDDYKLFRHKIVATGGMNRRRKKELSRRAQYRSNAVVIKTVYIMTMSTPSKSGLKNTQNSQNSSSSNGQNVSPVKSTYNSRINGSLENKKRSKGNARSPTRNLIGFGKRQLLSSRKLK